MKDGEVFFQTNLERYSYRFLQQTAKAMGLPANVKKMYLIQLINAKKFSSPSELDSLVRHIRQDQQYRALVRKNCRKNNTHQSPEISSTNNGKSPMISKTLKQLNHSYKKYTQDGQSPMKYPQTVSARLPTITSDRVLRSSKRVTKPSYLLNETLLTLLKGPDSDKPREQKIKIDRVDENKKKAASRTLAKKIIESWQDDGKLATVPKSENMLPPLDKQARKLSSIYPLQPENIKLPIVEVRRADGSMSKIRAIILRPLAQCNYSWDRQTQAGGTNRSITRPNASQPVSKQNSRSAFIVTALETVHRTSNATEVPPSNNYTVAASTVMSPDSTTQSGEYYHKKIRAEQVRSARKSRKMAQPVPVAENKCNLPKINEVISMFDGVHSRGVTRPLYVQVDTEHVIAPIPPQIPEIRRQYQGSSTLETIYNLRLPYQRTLHMTTTSNTHTVYSTHLISTAKAHPSTTGPVHNVFNNAMSPHENQPFYTNDYEMVPRATHYEVVPQTADYEVVPMTNDYEVVPQAKDFYNNFQCHAQNNIVGRLYTPTDFQRSCSSVETMTTHEQELGANITFPEMMEDTIEIFSQDEGYMQRMGMDIRMRCILCNWAGPKIILEYHIRKDHPKEIVECQSNEFCALYTLGGLAARRVWVCQVLQLCGELYVLSAKYDEPDCFLAALSTVSYKPDDSKTACMTTYNKVTGEPFTWKGVITDLPPSMPYDNDPYNCFRLQLSKMDIMPNTANLKLMYREFNVFVGQPELNNVQINLAVKISD